MQTIDKLRVQREITATTTFDTNAIIRRSQILEDLWFARNERILLVAAARGGSIKK